MPEVDMEEATVVVTVMDTGVVTEEDTEGDTEEDTEVAMGIMEKSQ